MIRGRILLTAGILCVMAPTAAMAQSKQYVEPVQLGRVAEKLGVTVIPSSPKEIELGNSATTMLAQPQKLEPFGISGMHEGARVTITCVGPDFIRVEADEIEPTPQRKTVTLKVGLDGSLTIVPPRPAPIKPPGA